MSDPIDALAVGACQVLCLSSADVFRSMGWLPCVVLVRGEAVAEADGQGVEGVFQP